MRTPALALMWELWRYSRWEIAWRLLLLSGLCVVVFPLLGEGAREAFAGIFLFLTAFNSLSLFTAMWSSGFDNKQTLFPFHLGFARPVGTTLLVACPLIYIALASALCFAIPATLLRFLIDLPCPVVPGSVCLAVLSAYMMGALWSPRSPLTRTLSVLAVAGVSAGVVKIWMARKAVALGALLSSPADWPKVFAFAAPHYAVLLLLFAGAVAVTTFAVDRQRHGEGLGPRRFPSVLQEWMDRLPRRSRPFGTPARARFWFEMRRSGYRVFPIGLGAAVAAFLAMSCMRLWGHALGESYVAVWVLMLLLCPLVYQIVGAELLLGLKRRQGAVWLSSFDATQAVENDALVATKLAVLTTSAFLGWLMMACAAVAWTALLGDFQDWRDAGEAVWPLLAPLTAAGWAAVVLVAVVVFVGGSAMLLTAGWWLVLFPRAFVAAVFVLFGFAALAALDLKHDWGLGALWRANGWLLAAATVSCTVLAVVRAVSSGSLGRRYLIPSFAVWTVFVAVAVQLYWKVLPDDAVVPVPALALAASSLALPLASVALAPLVLASHRHR